MIIFEDSDIRIEGHLPQKWLIVGFDHGFQRDIYRCGEKYTDGSECATVTLFPESQNICKRQFKNTVRDG